MGFAYVRGGRNFEKNTFFKRALAFCARLTKSPAFFRACYKGSVNKQKSYYIHAVPIHKLTTLKQVKSLIDYCVEERCWCILEFHGIDNAQSKEYSEVFCWLEDDFIELCEYVKGLRDKDKLEVNTPLQALALLEEIRNES